MTKRTIRAPRGTEISCRSWLTEAPMRMLMNNLDPEVGERPDDLVVYGGTGKAARNWECYDAIVATLKTLGPEETLLVQSGKPVGVVPTHADAPRVVIANANLVPKWATWEEFRRLEAMGLTMFGQMTAGSWIYIGTQGILQGTYECFASLAEKDFGGDLRGRFVLSAGLGGMGGAQPLAAAMTGAAFLGVEVDPARVERRLETRYLDRKTESLDEALKMIDDAVAKKEAISVGLIANAGDVYPDLVRRGRIPDVVTEQTSAHDPLNGYVPRGLSLAAAADLRKADPKEYVRRARESMAGEVTAMLEMQKRGAKAFDYGNNIRAEAVEGGEPKAFEIIGFVPLYIRPLFCRGMGPFRWAALSGDPEDIRVTDEAVKEVVPDDRSLHRWLDLARERVAFQGLPSRICWLGLGDRDRVGVRFNELVREGRIKAPIVIGRDHLDCGSVASPNRETEGMKDGSDAIADWPLLNFALNAVCGATWVSFHHGGGVGMGYALHAGLVIVADGTEAAERRLRRVLTWDPMSGVIRHVDAGYEEAIAFAEERGVRIPMRRRT